MSKIISNNSPVLSDLTQATDNQRETPLIYAIPMILMDVISKSSVFVSKKNKPKSKSITKNAFSSKSLPKISLSDYLSRIWKYCNFEEGTLILALIYIDRICLKTGLILNEFNVHRLLFLSVLVAIKYNEDKYYSNVFYSKIGGIEVKEMNKLEQKFILNLSFDLFVHQREYEQYQETLDKNSFSFSKKV